jgi:hypothetical protein
MLILNPAYWGLFIMISDDSIKSIRKISYDEINVNNKLGMIYNEC